jgi:hypothetical protein
MQVHAQAQVGGVDLFQHGGGRTASRQSGAARPRAVARNGP